MNARVFDWSKRSLALRGSALLCAVSGGVAATQGCSYEDSTTVVYPERERERDAGSTAVATCRRQRGRHRLPRGRATLLLPFRRGRRWFRRLGPAHPNLYTAAREHSLTTGDCNDDNSAVRPGLGETCDGVDNDCDGRVDEDVVNILFADQDADGYGDPNLSLEGCVRTGFVADSTDCNDLDPTVRPGRLEACDNKDNDCDGEVDDGARVTYYRDADGDGFGNPLNSLEACASPPGFVLDPSDCDDTRPAVSPRGVEECNNLDDDCDGEIDQFARTCSNDCGTGEETCTAGIFEGCTAPQPTKISSRPPSCASLQTFRRWNASSWKATWCSTTTSPSAFPMA